MSWNVEIVEILNKENEFEGEDWWAVTDEDKIENTFEVRNKEVAMDLCDLLNTKDSKISELKIKLAFLGHAIERAFNDRERASCQLITDYYLEGIESHGLTDLPEDWIL